MHDDRFTKQSTTVTNIHIHDKCTEHCGYLYIQCSAAQSLVLRHNAGGETPWLHGPGCTTTFQQIYCQGSRKSASLVQLSPDALTSWTGDNFCHATHLFGYCQCTFEVPWWPVGTQQVQPWRRVCLGRCRATQPWRTFGRDWPGISRMRTATTKKKNPYSHARQNKSI